MLYFDFEREFISFHDCHPEATLEVIPSELAIVIRIENLVSPRIQVLEREWYEEDEGIWAADFSRISWDPSDWARAKTLSQLRSHVLACLHHHDFVEFFHQVHDAWVEGDDIMPYDQLPPTIQQQVSASWHELNWDTDVVSLYEDLAKAEERRAGGDELDEEFQGRGNRVLTVRIPRPHCHLIVPNSEGCFAFRGKIDGSWIASCDNGS